MNRLVLFGGTTEGRELASFLKAHEIPAVVCVASEYGAELIEPGDAILVRTGRMDQEAMGAFLNQEQPWLVVDATHPYAVEVSRCIRAACKEQGIQLVRVLRERLREQACTRFAHMDELVAWLNQTDEVIFVATGSKEAEAFTRVHGYQERVFLRLLPSPDAVRTCLKLGYPAKHLICMQGPFSQDLNEAMFRQTRAKILVTKESGRNGGFGEKCEAARACNMRVALLVRPTEERGYALKTVQARILEGVRR